MKLIKELKYKGYELTVFTERNPKKTYAVDIRIDDHEVEGTQGYCGLHSESEAISVGWAFIDGLKYVEETCLENNENIVRV